MDYKTTPKKKPWNTPEIYLLNTADVNGGSGAAYKEGVNVGGTNYQLNRPGGTLAGTVQKFGWDHYHS